MQYGQPDAEDAEDSQKAQKNSFEVSFAISAESLRPLRPAVKEFP
jgi:hypothetical protein